MLASASKNYGNYYAYTTNDHVLWNHEGKAWVPPAEISCLDCNDYYIIAGLFGVYTLYLLDHDF